MRLFDILQLSFPELKPEDCKIHLACWNGWENPLEEYFAGRFEAWQSRQSRENFKRPYIVSLIQMPEKDHWLFAGVHRAFGSTYDPEIEYHVYLTEPVEEANELDGRLIVHFTRPSRQSYLLGEKWVNQLTVSELRPVRLTIGDFPGFRNCSISRAQLDIIVGQNLSSWRNPLASVAGIYLITDTQSGKLYVGSACGKGGIWGRWCDYAKTGHGGNTELLKILKEQAPGYEKNFRFTILETAELESSREEILKRESYWKEALASREFGHNRN